MMMFRALSWPVAAASIFALGACEAGPAGPLLSSDLPSATHGAAAGGTVIVSPSNMRGWLFYQDTDDTQDPSLGTFVSGPDTPLFGVGSVQISTSGLSRPNIATYQFTGTPLADITALRFATYNPSAGNGGSASRSGYLHFNVDFNGTDKWQRRLVYVPSVNGAVLQDAWQEWDAIDGGAALWRYSGPTWPGTSVSGMTARPWSQILAEYPGVRIRVTDAFLGIRVGEPYQDGYTENIDALTFGTAAGVTVFNFEPYEVATSIEQCQNRGWQTVVRADQSTFQNQGDCVRYVTTGV